jgi:hypothetical protein
MKRILIAVICVAVLLAGCDKPSSAAVSPTVTPTASADITTAAATVAATPSPTPSATPTPVPTPTPTPTAPPDPNFSVTTGLAVKGPYKPICVMIENMPAARPQKGMGLADIVYEMYVENCSMTRFMCVFNDNIPKEVGPVRSARVYYADIAEEFNGAYCFFGGSQYADASIYKRLKTTTLQVAVNGIQGKYGKYYWRSKDRKAPHNVYTNLTNITPLITAPPLIKHFLFSASSVLAGDDVTKINIPYNKSSINTTYVYDPANKNYKRSVAGKPFMDALTKKQITVTNVIVQNTKLRFTEDFKGHVFIYFIGKGTADIFSGGKHIKATWAKKSTNDPTTYYDESGKEVTLLPGNTWVQVIYNKVPFTYSK